jgi:hypothetical protein
LLSIFRFAPGVSLVDLSSICRVISLDLVEKLTEQWWGGGTRGWGHPSPMDTFLVQIISCEKVIQLAYSMSVVLLRCLFVPEIMHRAVCLSSVCGGLKLQMKCYTFSFH